jgi:serine-type D-Ala-D-Ala carboxypeptidase
VLSSAVGLVGDADSVLWEDVAAAAPTTRFDFASLTKPFVATLALVLDADGRLPLDLPIGEVFPRAAPKLARLRLADLLRHRSGLAAWTPLYARCRSREEVLDLLLSGSLLGTRAGTYSDLDYVLWGLAAERRLGQPLAVLLLREVLGPLAIAALPSPGGGPDLAASSMGTAKEVELAAAQGIEIAALPPPEPGQPQDGNGRFLTALPESMGLSGHCGLFGTARDLWRLGAEWLAPGRVLQEGAVLRALAGGGPFALGWWRRRRKGSGGPALSRGSFGHSGFAGGNLWIDPERRRIAILLGYRIDPGSDLNRSRRSFNALALRA